MNTSLIGIPFDKTQTLRKGAAKAPDMLRNIFPKLETNICLAHNSVFAQEEHSAPILSVDLTEHFVEDLGNIRKEDFKKPKYFPVILGGEHTITRYCVKELKPEKIVVFDAHPDCEDSDGHNGVVRRLAEQGFEVVLFGTRVISKEELKFIKERKIKIASLEDLKKLSGKIYLSIDFDVLDPSVLRAVGNPEPDGLKVKEVVEAVRILSKNLIAIDFAEFTPFGIESLDLVEALIAGKVIYGCLAEIINGRV